MYSILAIPRASGGYPLEVAFTVTSSNYSPRKRGLSLVLYAGRPSNALFPAQAGVIRHDSTDSRLCNTIPRASGGYPNAYRSRPRRLHYSPRKRGLSFGSTNVLRSFKLFPAQAGVIPFSVANQGGVLPIPRASGGYPSPAMDKHNIESYSPRKRGLSLQDGHGDDRSSYSPRKRGLSSRRDRHKMTTINLFPAKAGVILEIRNNEQENS